MELEKKSLKEKIVEFFSGLWSKFLNWYRTSKFGAIVQKVGWFIEFAFWPLAWIKARTFDKLRFDVQKRVVSIIFLLPVMLGFIIFFAYPLITSFIYSFSTVTISPEGVNVLFNTFFNSTSNIICLIGNLKIGYLLSTATVKLWVQTSLRRFFSSENLILFSDLYKNNILIKNIADSILTTII